MRVGLQAVVLESTDPEERVELFCRQVGQADSMLLPLSATLFIKCTAPIEPTPIRITEANKMHYFSTLFLYTTLHVSDRSTVLLCGWNTLIVCCGGFLSFLSSIPVCTVC